MKEHKSESVTDIIKTQLINSGLTNDKLYIVKLIGKFLADNPQLPLLIGIIGYFGEVIINQVLHPEWGIGANIFSPIFFDVSPVEGQFALNAMQGIFQGMFVAGGATQIVSGVASKAKEMFYLPDLKHGRAENQYKKMILMVDATNEAVEGSTHGDFYNELYRYLSSTESSIIRNVFKLYGPICEITPDYVPEPAEEPIPAYFRTTNVSNTEFLRDLVRADRSRATISILMSRSHTVWDEKFTPSQELFDIVNNMNLTISDTLGTGMIPKLAIINNRIISTHGAFDPVTGQSRSDTVSVYDYFKDKGYEVILAEQEVMNRLVRTFKEKAYTRILLMDDGTLDGERIAMNWLRDYKKLKLSGEKVPKIIEIPKGKLSEILKKQKYDGIFLIGADDTRVAEAAQTILSKQSSTSKETEGYKRAPIEVLMEGRGSADKLFDIQQKGGGLHFVHEILSQKVVNILLKKK